MIETMIRVPEMQGLPWQTFGSTDTRFRQSIEPVDVRILRHGNLVSHVLRGCDQHHRIPVHESTHSNFRETMALGFRQSMDRHVVMVFRSI